MSDNSAHIVKYVVINSTQPIGNWTRQLEDGRVGVIVQGVTIATHRTAHRAIKSHRKYKCDRHYSSCHMFAYMSDGTACAVGVDCFDPDSDTLYVDLDTCFLI